MTVVDELGNVVFSLSTALGQPDATATRYLKAGTYTVRYSTSSGSASSPVKFNLFMFQLSDGVGPYATSTSTNSSGTSGTAAVAATAAAVRARRLLLHLHRLLNLEAERLRVHVLMTDPQLGHQKPTGKTEGRQGRQFLHTWDWHPSFVDRDSDA